MIEKFRSNVNKLLYNERAKSLAYNIIISLTLCSDQSPDKLRNQHKICQKEKYTTNAKSNKFKLQTSNSKSPKIALSLSFYTYIGSGKSCCQYINPTASSHSTYIPILYMCKPSIITNQKKPRQNEQTHCSLSLIIVETVILGGFKIYLGQDPIPVTLSHKTYIFTNNVQTTKPNKQSSIRKQILLLEAPRQPFIIPPMAKHPQKT